ncbi:hypothetical protein [Spiroplasma endosymbiont of Virgichneumon dumeticola]|uniref:hypothetical protein n=1 Tax=Spiroplasma endosymbiont of Virgichneumon dumeticola TaxID=3139323 RepID=UPI0035C8F18F
MFEEQITVDDYLQFFCVFNDKNENIGGNTDKNQDRQLLYISNVTNYRTSPHMYLWRKQWNWMSSIILFKLKNNVLHI